MQAWTLWPQCNNVIMPLEDTDPPNILLGRTSTKNKGGKEVEVVECQADKDDNHVGQINGQVVVLISR